MKRAIVAGAALCAVWAPAADCYPVSAIVLKIDRAHRSFEASCQAIPGYMAAMAMPFSVREEKALRRPVPATLVRKSLRDTTLRVGGTK